MTSSVAAVADGHGEKQGYLFTEADWSDPEGPNISPYARSKTLAERAAWDFMAREKPSFALSSILPALVLGPVLGSDFGVSPEIVRRLLSGEAPGAPRLGWAVVDVRDVADLHVRALMSDRSDGQRYIASNGFVWMAEMASVLREACPERAARIPKGKIPDLVLRAIGLFDPAVRSLLPDLGRQLEISHDKAVRELGWTPRSAADAIRATGRSLIELGLA